jgi:hypothetical protein
MVPHYVRFARSLALLGLGATALGCGGADAPPDAAAALDAPSSTTDAPSLMADASTTTEDASVPLDAFDVCGTCSCVFPTAEDAGTDAGVLDCNTVEGGAACCAAVGPLFPPELAV